MEKHPDHTHTISLNEDTSRTELLPVDSDAGPFSLPTTRDGQESAEEQWHNRAMVVKGWPQSSKTLQEARWKIAASLVIDACIALIPLVFVGKSHIAVQPSHKGSSLDVFLLIGIALSIVALRLSGSPISTSGDRIKAATTLGPTVFPILFAAIIGRSLRSLASYQAERGTKLGTLEQLMGSLTIFGTVELQFLLRTFDLLGVSLILLWALSPVGGQASLRLLGTRTQPTSIAQDISYLNPESASILSRGGNTVSSLGFYTNALYLSALFTPPAGQASAVDTWSNVKIPTIEKLESTRKSDVDGWYAVPPENASYSSLVGLPIDGTRKSGSYHFSVESLYMVLDCPTIADFTLVNGTSQGGFSIQFIVDDSTQQQLYPNQPSYPTVKPSRVNFSAASNIETDNGFTANCSLTRSSVESNITCDHGLCSVTQIRRSKFDQRPPGYTPFFYGTIVDDIETYWPTSGGGGEHPGMSTPTEYFIADPTMDSLSKSVGTWGISLKGLSAELFSERLSLAFNTYWQCSIVPWYQTGNFPSNTSSLNYGNPDISELVSFNTTTTTVTTFTEIYFCNRMWATILFVASGVLFLCGLCGAIVKHMTRGPKILGFVTTMTRDNPYIELPSDGCTLDGLERARLLKDVKVKMQDVSPDDAVGHIAFGSADEFRKGKLLPGRLYA